MSSIFYVAGDIGGTNCRLELVELRVRKGSKVVEEVLVEQKKYRSSKYPHLQVIIQEFLKKVKGTPSYPKACCLAVAGPVANNVCTATNLAGWSTLDGERMAKELDIPVVRLINDFEAIGYGVLALRDDEKFVVNRGQPQQGSPIAIIGAGTGLGEAFLTSNGGEYVVCPTEGGHSDFAPRTPVEFELLQYVLQQSGATRVSAERVVSGPGLAIIYAFLAQRFPSMVAPEINKIMSVPGADKPFIISKHARKAAGLPFDPLCSLAHDIFESCYGAETGNLALKTLPYGGVYLCGGVAPKILWAFKEKKIFWESFLEKGRMKGIMEKLPLYVCTNEDIGLLGSRVFGRRLLTRAGFLTASVRIEMVSSVRSKL